MATTISGTKRAIENYKAHTLRKIDDAYQAIPLVVPTAKRGYGSSTLVASLTAVETAIPAPFFDIAVSVEQDWNRLNKTVSACAQQLEVMRQMAAMFSADQPMESAEPIAIVARSVYAGKSGGQSHLVNDLRRRIEGLLPEAAKSVETLVKRKARLLAVTRLAVAKGQVQYLQRILTEARKDPDTVVDIHALEDIVADLGREVDAQMASYAKSFRDKD